MFKYLVLKALTFQKVFGILTTYAEWRICWLKSSDAAAQSEITSNPSEATLQDMKEIPDWRDDYMEEKDAEDDREFNGTAILPCTNAELPKYLVSTLLKMYASSFSGSGG
jgi:hypothetical protein